MDGDSPVESTRARRSDRGKKRPAPAFDKSLSHQLLDPTNAANSSGTSTADDAQGSGVQEKREEAEFEKELQRLKDLVPNSAKLCRHARWKNKKSRKVQNLPIVDIRLLRNMFDLYATPSRTDERYIEAILSNDVLSILRLFKKECVDISSTKELLIDAFVLSNLGALSGDLMDETAVHSWRFDLQEHPFIIDDGRAYPCELVARYAAMVYRRCPLINETDWNQQDHEEYVSTLPWRGHAVAVCMVIMTFIDLLQNPDDGFFALALSSKLARPCFERYRPLKVFEAFSCPFINKFKPIQYQKNSLAVNYSVGAPRYMFDPTVSPQSDLTATVPFTAEEELSLLSVYQRYKSFKARTGREGGDVWELAAEIIPGRSRDECKAAYQAIETRLLDPLAAQQHKDKIAGWNYVKSPDVPQYPSEETPSTTVNEGSVDDLARKRSRISAMFCLDSDSEGEGSPNPKRSRSSFEQPYRSPLGEVEPVLGETMAAGSLGPKESRQSVEPPYRSFSGATRPVLGETAEAGFSDLWKSDSAIKRAQCPSSGTHNASFNEMLDGKHLPSNLEQDIDNEDSLFIPESARKDDPIDDEQESVGDGVRTVDNAIAAGKTAIELLSDPAFEARNRSKDIRFIKTTMPKTLSELRRSEEQIRDESLQAHQARAAHHKPENFLDQVGDYVKDAERCYEQRSAELRVQREENAKLRSENVELSAEIVNLSTENTVLKAKIAELEAAKAAEQHFVDELISGQKDTKYLQYLAGSRGQHVARLQGTLSGVEQENTKIKSQLKDSERRLNFLQYQASVQAQLKKRLEAQGEGSEKASRGESA